MEEVSQSEFIAHIYDSNYTASEDRDGKMHYYRRDE